VFNSKLDYWYDEVVVLDISKQDVGLLLNTIISEPHPPGFYLFLKLLGINSIFEGRLFITIISYFLVFITLVYGYKQKIINNYNISTGLSLFLCSFTFLEITSFIKQDSISFPVFLFFLLTILKLINEPSKNTTTIFLAITSSLLLLFLGYIPYVISISILIGCLYICKQIRPLIATLILHVGLFSVYYLYFFESQLKHNQGRFSWLAENYNSFGNALSKHLTGMPLYNLSTDLIFFIFLTLLSLSVYTIYLRKRILQGSKNLLRLQQFLPFIIAVLMALSYITQAFPRIRYVYFLYFLLSIYAGWGLDFLLEKNKKAVLLVIFFFFSSFNYFIIQQTHDIKRSMYEFMEDEAKNDTFGFIDEHPLSPFSYKVENPNNTNIIPVNVFQPNMFEDAPSFSKEILALDGKFDNLSESEIRGLVGKNNLTNYFYRIIFRESATYYDPDRKVLNVLSTSCSLEKTTTIKYRYIIFIFKNCVF
jgi:hypothetical protein